jgi:two-component system, cell cycle response regulator
VTRARPREVEPVTNRLRVLQGVRLLTAAALPVIAALTGSFEASLIPLALGYALVIGTVELARRRVTRLDPSLASSMVFVDGLVLAVAVSRTGGYRSPLLFLVFLLVIAATLLVSYRTGLELATWCALLLLLAHAASDAGIIGTEPRVSDRFALVSACTFLVFALSAAAFSWVNERSLRHSRAQLGWLVELSTDLERSHRAEDAMATLVRHVCGRLGFTRAVVIERRGDGWWGVCDDGVVESLIETHGSDATLPPLERLTSTSPLLVRTLEGGLLDAVLPDARNVVVVPVVADDEHFGLVAAEWGGRDDAQIPILTVRALAQAGMHTASALHTAALLDEVERLATRDALTGIANRRLFDESLAREAARSQRLRTPLSLVVFDVDHFKQINDTYGHLIGDSVLRQLADAIVASTKSFDVAARYGGDEFVLLLPGCSHADVMGVAERVRTEIRRRVIEVPVTVSVGLATMPENAVDGDRLLSAADGALYEAKRNGRDRAAASTRQAGVAPPAMVGLDDAPLARGA